jgi:hypothetical protein
MINLLFCFQSAVERRRTAGERAQEGAFSPPYAAACKILQLRPVNFVLFPD